MTFKVQTRSSQSVLEVVLVEVVVSVEVVLSGAAGECD